MQEWPPSVVNFHGSRSSIHSTGKQSGLAAKRSPRGHPAARPEALPQDAGGAQQEMLRQQGKASQKFHGNTRLQEELYDAELSWRRNAKHGKLFPGRETTAVETGEHKAFPEEPPGPVPIDAASEVERQIRMLERQVKEGLHPSSAPSSIRNKRTKR